jgi:hypothetical protein
VVVAASYLITADGGTASACLVSERTAKVARARQGDRLVALRFGAFGPVARAPFGVNIKG